MAKMFYTMDEVQDKLGSSSDEIKKMVQDGSLREFRDGAKVMFKVDEVDDIALGGTANPSDNKENDELVLADDFDLSLDDSSDILGLTGSSIGLVEGSSIGLVSDDSQFDLSSTGASLSTPEASDDMYDLTSTGSSIGLAGGDSDHINLDDTAMPMDKDDTVVTTHGVNVLDDTVGGTSSGTADPLGGTDFASDIADIDEQMPLDGSSSGSGLLDLSREADDTSLGAELLDEIYPEVEAAPVSLVSDASGSVAAQTADATASSPAPEFAAPSVAAARAVHMYDSKSGIFGVMLLFPMLVLIYLAFVVAANMAGIRPEALGKIGENNLYIIGGAGVLTLITFIIGIVPASSGPGKPKAARKAKPKKSKPKKAKKKK